MSTVEAGKWMAGEIIPENKFFTSKQTGAFAYDDPDLARKAKEDPNFSFGLESFSVRSDCVSETDESIFVTIKPCVMDQRRRIIPAGAKQAWLLGNCRFVQGKA